MSSVEQRPIQVRLEFLRNAVEAAEDVSILQDIENTLKDLVPLEMPGPVPHQAAGRQLLAQIQQRRVLLGG